MIIRGTQYTFVNFISLILYYGFARYLPSDNSFFLGHVSTKTRRFLVKRIFKKCGNNVNVERGAFFGNGLKVEIGDNSGIGINAQVPHDIKIGNNVMMGPNCYVLERNHAFERLDIPMMQQGFTASKSLIIEDDVWIGREVLITAGRTIKKGSIVAARCVLCRDFDEYSIIGGNPSKLIRSRL